MGPALVVVPEGQTPFEAYQLLNEPTRPNQTFEGAFAWMVHTQRLRRRRMERRQIQWNPPTSVTLAPGATKTYGVKFLLGDQIRKIEATLRSQSSAGRDRHSRLRFADGYGRAVCFLNYERKVSRVGVRTAGRDYESAKTSDHRTVGRLTRCAERSGDARALTITYDDGSKAIDQLLRHQTFNRRPSPISATFFSPTSGSTIRTIRFIAVRP